MLKEDYAQIINSSVNWNLFADKTILITGANGFLPAYMVEIFLLLNKGILQKTPCIVLALVRNRKHTLERFSEFLEDDNFEIIVQDVSGKDRNRRKNRFYYPCRESCITKIL